MEGGFKKSWAYPIAKAHSYPFLRVVYVYTGMPSDIDGNGIGTPLQGFDTQARIQISLFLA